AGGAAGDGSAQQGVTATSGAPAAIARVRAGVAAIARETPGYRRTTHDLQGFSLEGGELRGLYRGRELRKLEARLFGETWRGSEEYYFAGGRLVFIHVVHERYAEPMGVGGVVATIEHRFYFDGGRLIRRVRTQRPPAARDLAQFDPELPTLLGNARLFAACAAAAGRNPPACTAPDR
ncbi:MAG TPA: hypothetical protein VM890_13115, partial [Longimicrobium sp.]|nr:hypothetical protein [Longimicrobium sp.]